MERHVEQVQRIDDPLSWSRNIGDMHQRNVLSTVLVVPLDTSSPETVTSADQKNVMHFLCAYVHIHC